MTGHVVDQPASPVDEHDPVELDPGRGRVRRSSRKPSDRNGPWSPWSAASIAGTQAAIVRARSSLGSGDLSTVEPGGVDGRVAELVGRGEHAQEPDVGGEPEHGGLVERGHQRGDAPPRGRGRGRSPCPASGRTTCDTTWPLSSAASTRALVGPAHQRRPCRPAAGTRRRSPRRRPAPRWRGRSSRMSSWVIGSSSPEATSSWSSTRSTPVTSSVTGCSTWRRVFISRK